MSITGSNVDSWVNEMARLASRFVAGFEDVYGYPPGEHYVLRSTDDSGRDALAAVLSGAGVRDLIEFYSHVSRISFPDVGPGFFVDEAECVVAGVRGAQPTRLSGVPGRTVVVFGSDGGGALFAVDRQTGEVVRLEGGSLIGDAYVVGEYGVQVIARDFEGFMRFLSAELQRQVPSGRQPSCSRPS
ncbi:hypothetical protein [Saccharomonospora cyanea]|uniref:hypothetical protein n=1 Tax=Saccharomonospora cyanea TaxID=40989 RepID=UPI001E2FBCBA|nr:hypothetical protein [Saccharomonospora cyanea]